MLDILLSLQGDARISLILSFIKQKGAQLQTLLTLIAPY